MPKALTLKLQSPVVGSIGRNTNVNHGVLDVLTQGDLSFLFQALSSCPPSLLYTSLCLVTWLDWFQNRRVVTRSPGCLLHCSTFFSQCVLHFTPARICLPNLLLKWTGKWEFPPLTAQTPCGQKGLQLCPWRPLRWWSFVQEKPCTWPLGPSLFMKTSCHVESYLDFLTMTPFRRPKRWISAGWASVKLGLKSEWPDLGDWTPWDSKTAHLPLVL